MINVKPDNDEIEHISDVHCPCEPVVLYRNPETGEEYGERGPVLVHHAMDGREFVEELLDEAMADDKGWRAWETVENA